MIQSNVRSDKGHAITSQSNSILTAGFACLHKVYLYLKSRDLFSSLQALTTGGIPGFIDVVFNMDSKFLQEDSLISQMKFADKKLVFYGDDTWMKLFPEHFTRTDGTTSFFVTDYTEVRKLMRNNPKMGFYRDNFPGILLFSFFVCMRVFKTVLEL